MPPVGPPVRQTGVDQLTAATGRFCTAIAGWTLARWSAATSDGRSRSDVTFELVQRIADLAADAEGQPRRRVPRLESAPALGDQLRVVVADLVAAGASEQVIAEAATLIADVRRAVGR
jgi:hypothetical protein